MSGKYAICQYKKTGAENKIPFEETHPLSQLNQRWLVLLRGHRFQEDSDCARRGKLGTTIFATTTLHPLLESWFFLVAGICLCLPSPRPVLKKNLGDHCPGLVTSRWDHPRGKVLYKVTVMYMHGVAAPGSSASLNVFLILSLEQTYNSDKFIQHHTPEHQ